MSFDCIKVTVDNYVATVVMDRPPVNALSWELRCDLVEAFDSFSDRDDVRVVILTGAGKIFSAGADLKERPNVGKTAGDYWRHNRLARECPNAVRECQKPVIAAVNGPALGAGLGLMVSCDIMLASDNAMVGMPEIDVGLAGGAVTLQSLFGRSRAARMLYTGMRISAAELYRLGVIECCVAPERLMDEAMAIAREIAAKSPVAVRVAKLSNNTIESMPKRDGYRFEQGATVALSKTDDAREAQRAFLEKRPPNFSGR